MEIRHSESENRFALFSDDGAPVGVLDYRPGETGELIATHTEVFSGFEGRGYAMQLLDALAEYARSRNLKIVPYCPYVIRAFRKFPEKFGDVASDSKRKNRP